MKKKLILLVLILLNLNLYSQEIVNFSMDFNNIKIPINNNLDVYLYFEDSKIIKSIKLDFENGKVVLPDSINDSIHRWLVVKYQDYFFTCKISNYSKQKIYCYDIKYKESRFFQNNTNSENFMIERSGKIQAFYTITFSNFTKFYPLKNKKTIKRPPDFKKKKTRNFYSY